MTLVTKIASGSGNATGAVHITQRQHDDNGMWQIEVTPASAPMVCTFQLQIKLGEDLTGWATVKTVTQAELGTSEGLKTYAEQVPLGVQMRVVSSNHDDAGNVWQVVLQE